jgi:hypothetical protein
MGDRAPDVELFAADGSSVRLRERLREGPMALVFLRHFG